MGTCVGKEYVQRNEDKQQPNKRLVVNCPICEESYDTQQRRPYIMCPNNHQICIQCLTSIKARSLKNKKQYKCPFCNEVCAEDMMGTDMAVFTFLKQEEETLKILPEDRKKLFAFSSIYLPALHKFIKEDAKAGKQKAVKVASIDTIRIRGRMLEDFEVLELDMFECLPNLKSLYLNNNHIKAVDASNYFQQKLQLLNLTNNRVVAMRQLLTDGAEPFKHLRTVILRGNRIQEIGGLTHLKQIQIVNLASNNIKSMKGLEAPQSLRHLNLEFNQITQMQFYDYFPKLCSLRLFGNQINSESWDQMMQQDWPQLRVLTASISAANLNLKQDQCMALKQQLNSINKVFEIAVIEAIEGEEKESDQKKQRRMIEMFSRTYQAQIHKSDESQVMRAIQQAMNRHPLGENINFKTAQYNRQIYQLDDKLWKYTKLSESQDPIDYLYSQRSFQASDPMGKFIAFASKSIDVVVGVCQFIAGPTRTVEFDLGMRRIRGSDVQDQPLYRLQNDEQVKKKDTKCMLGLNCAERKLELWVDGAKIYSLAMEGEQWEEYKFFICLKEKGNWLRVHRHQPCKDS